MSTYYTSEESYVKQYYYHLLLVLGTCIVQSLRVFQIHLAINNIVDINMQFQFKQF